MSHTITPMIGPHGRVTMAFACLDDECDYREPYTVSNAPTAVRYACTAAHDLNVCEWRTSYDGTTTATLQPGPIEVREWLPGRFGWRYADAPPAPVL